MLLLDSNTELTGSLWLKPRVTSRMWGPSVSRRQQNWRLFLRALEETTLTFTVGNAKSNATGSIVNGPSFVIILVGWGRLDSCSYLHPTHSATTLQGPTIVHRRTPSSSPPHSSPHSTPARFKQAALPGLGAALSLSAFTSLPLPIHATV